LDRDGVSKKEVLLPDRCARLEDALSATAAPQMRNELSAMQVAGSPHERSDMLG
jgi:hypothetical protein